MNRTVYDTRFFMELYYSKDEALLKKIKREKARKEKYMSAVLLKSNDLQINSKTTTPERSSEI